MFWTTVYWLYVTLLAPTARAIGVQMSVLLMVWLFVLLTRIARRDARLPQLEPSYAVPLENRSGDDSGMTPACDVEAGILF